MCFFVRKREASNNFRESVLCVLVQNAQLFHDENVHPSACYGWKSYGSSKIQTVDICFMYTPLQMI